MRLIDADALANTIHGIPYGDIPNQRLNAEDVYRAVADAPAVAIGDDHIVIHWTPELDKMARDLAYRGLNEFSFMGKSIREWVEIILETPRWINVKDRLPDLEEQVVIVCEWTGISGEKYREIVLDSFKTMGFLGYKPLFWMPLPDTPEEVPGES